MPYGIPKEKGGDSAENVRKMESCVKNLMNKDPKLTKDRAIAICKSSLGFTKGK
jgi:hypothetical protein